MKRIERKRSKGWRMPENTVYVGRPSRFGNPFKIGMEINMLPFVVVNRMSLTEEQQGNGYLDQELATQAFRIWATETYTGIEKVAFWREQLQGKDLACWCKEGEPCHGDVLVELSTKEK